MPKPCPAFPALDLSETSEERRVKRDQWEREMVAYRRSKPLSERVRKGWLEGWAAFHLQVFGAPTRYSKRQKQLKHERWMAHMVALAEKRGGRHGI